jgi:hypothetical protein
VSRSSGNSGSGFAEVGRENGYKVDRTPEAELAFWQSQLDLTYKHWGSGQAEHGGEGESARNGTVIELTAAEEALRKFLIKMAARHADPMSYGIMAHAVDPDGRLGFRDGGKRATSLIYALYDVNRHAHQNGEPMLGALAVSRSSGNSGSGFAEVGRENGYKIDRTPEAELAFWQSQLDLTYKHWGNGQAEHGAEDESLLDRVDAQFAAVMTEIDARFAAVMTELVTIKRLVRQLLHG